MFDRSIVPVPLRIAAIVVGLLIAFFGWNRLFGSKFIADGEDARWDRAVAISQATKQPGLVLVTADWCGGCQWLHQNVLSKSAVKAEMAHYTFFKVDMTNPTPATVALSNKLGVHSYPTLIRYDHSGNEAGRKQITSAEKMAAWLQSGY